MSVLANRIYYINSENRVSGTSSDFQYEVIIPPDMAVDTACVLSMTIPKSFYLVRDRFNQVNVTIDGVPYLVTVPPGNYSAKTFLTVFSGLLNALGQGTFTMTRDEITGKYTYTYTGTASSLSFDLDSPSLLGHQMGFPEVSSTAFENSTGVFRLVSTNVLDFVGTSTLFLHSDMVSDSTSILQEVYTDNTVPFSNIVYNCKFPAMYSKTLSTKTSTVFRFSITDEHNDEVFLNGQDICVTLLLYKKG